jgi:hypothetical protein
MYAVTGNGPRATVPAMEWYPSSVPVMLSSMKSAASFVYGFRARASIPHEVGSNFKTRQGSTGPVVVASGFHAVTSVA